jgi:hypothetical protein
MQLSKCLAQRRDLVNEYSLFLSVSREAFQGCCWEFICFKQL